MPAYKEMYGEQFQFVLKSYHKCGLCHAEMLFDLDTLYNHVTSCHNLKIKEYVDQHVNSDSPAVDADGAPILKRPLQDGDQTPAKKVKPSSNNSLSITPSPKVPSGLTITPVMPKALQQEVALIHEQKVVHNDEEEDFNTGTITRVMPKALKQKVVKNEEQDYTMAFVERGQERDENGHVISNDFADYMLVECQICSLQTPMTRLRAHTKSAHGVTITEYKAQFGQLEPVEPVYHRCGICGELIFLDSDALAVHLKSGGHPRISHKEYNDAYMVDSRSSKWYVNEQEREHRAEQRALRGSPHVRGIGGTMRGSVVPKAHRGGIGFTGHKIMPTRGRGWRGRGGRGRAKKKYEYDKDYGNGAYEFGDGTWGESSSSQGPRRRARMGQGAYDEKEYDALLKMQVLENYDLEAEDDEWPELRVEEHWGQTPGEFRRKMREEEKVDEWQPKLETEDAEEHEIKFHKEEPADSAEEEEYAQFNAESSNSFSNLAKKSLDLGPKKLEVIMLDDLEDDPDEEESNHLEQDTLMFNFNTFSTYNEKITQKTTNSDANNDGKSDANDDGKSEANDDGKSDANDDGKSDANDDGKSDANDHCKSDANDDGKSVETDDDSTTKSDENDDDSTAKSDKNDDCSTAKSEENDDGSTAKSDENENSNNSDDNMNDDTSNDNSNSAETDDKLNEDHNDHTSNTDQKHCESNGIDAENSVET